MDFQFSAPVAATVLPYVGLMGVFTARIAYKANLRRKPTVNIHKETNSQQVGGSVWRDTILYLMIFVLVMGVVNCITWDASGKDITHHSNARYVAGALGLESGRSYPLILGQTFGADSANSVTTGGKQPTTTIKVKPDPVIGVSFTSQGVTRLLLLPLAKVTVIQKDGPETMRLYLKNPRYGDASVKDVMSPCKTIVRNLFLYCQRHRIKTVVSLKASDRLHGLTQLVLDNLKQAVLQMSPATYSKYFLGK